MRAPAARRRAPSRHPSRENTFSGALKSLAADRLIERDIEGKRCYRLALPGAAADPKREADLRTDVDALRAREAARERARQERAAARAAARADADSPGVAIVAPPVAPVSADDSPPGPGPATADPGESPTRWGFPDSAIGDGMPAQGELFAAPAFMPPGEAEQIATAMLAAVVRVLSSPDRAEVESRLGEQVAHAQRLAERNRLLTGELEGVTRERDALRERARQLRANLEQVLAAPRVDDRTRKALENLMRAPDYRTR